MVRLLAALLLVAAVGPSAAAQTSGSLRPFASEAELYAFLDSLRSPRPVSAAPVPSSTAATSASQPTTPPGWSILSRVSRPGRSDVVVSGRVTDAWGDELPGVVVAYGDATEEATTTNIDGAFTLHLSATGGTLFPLVFSASSVGYDRASTLLSIAEGDSIRLQAVLEESDEALEDLVVTASAPTVSNDAVGASITNNQTLGVDEGGIVKRLGDLLIVLRRGRLFTIDIAGGRLRQVDRRNAFGDGIDPSGAWYDELLLVGRTAVVVGYSYDRTGTELVLHDIAPDGRLHYRSTYHLRSNDYYSSSNYASRVVDGRLVFYTPLWLGRLRGPFADRLPALRRWVPGTDGGAFEPIATYTSLYRPAGLLNPQRTALHTVTTCDVRDGALTCSATAVFGPSNQTFYVSGEAVYVWASSGGYRDAAEKNVVYRLPLSGERPGALGVEGVPTNQFSFLESPDGHLNVLVEARGDAPRPWGTAQRPSRLALLRAPLSAFGAGDSPAPPAWYRALPDVSGHVRQRFVGDHLLYSSTPTYRQRRSARRPASVLHAVDWRTGRATSLLLSHDGERIEAMGRHAVVVGSQGENLTFTSVRLGAQPRFESRYTVRGAAQAESRSHGFFYRSTGSGGGTVGLPILTQGSYDDEDDLGEGSARIVYVRNRRGRLSAAGSLHSRPTSSDDGCLASCVDWYGNARPIFIDRRVFALLGYELVEGVERLGRVREVRRLTLLPGWRPRP